MKRSKHSLSHYNLLSCDMGELVPIGLTEVLPGDTIQHATSALIRVSPLLAPVMHPVQVRIHHWFVPHRILWNKFEDFITGGPDGADDSEFPVVRMPSSGAAVGSLADYLGVPPDVPDLECSALPFRAYSMIYNEWYRDQDLVDPLPISFESGFDDVTNKDLVNVAWEKDYFTSARPWEQKGPGVNVPFAGVADITPTGSPISSFFTDSGGNQIDVQTLGEDVSGYRNIAAQLATNRESLGIGVNPQEVADSLEVDMSAVSAVNINDLREAFALQRYEEARARYGSRYTEYLRYLGIRSSDARLQRPEYLGGGRQTIQFSEVLQTAEGAGNVGDLYGHGISALRSNRYRRFFEEHGYVVSMISVKPRTIYMQGLARTWNRRTKEDFFQRELQHIGQQEVLKKELYAASEDPDDIFGYQDRYDEYRRTESRVSGEFRTSMLDHWHYARSFANEPALNSDFVTSVPTKRVNAEQTQDCLYIMANHSIQARRLVAKTGKSFIY